MGLKNARKQYAIVCRHKKDDYDDEVRIQEHGE